MTDTSIQNHIRKLLGNVFGPDAAESPAIRAANARTVAEVLTDLRDSAAAARQFGVRASYLDYIRAGVHKDADAIARIRRDYSRAVEVTALADTPGLDPRPLLLGDGQAGLDFGVPMVREHSIDASKIKGSSPVLPGAVTGNPFGLVDPPTPIDAGAGTVTIEDVGEGEKWHISVCYSDAARQIRDFIDPASEPMLDAELLAIADRGAERAMVQKLETGAGGTRSGSADIAAALDDAEAAAGTLAGQTLMVVSPTDWPSVRRAVAPSWTTGPHPIVALSVGATAGTVTLVGQSAAHLFIKEPYADGRQNPETWTDELTVVRPFLAAIRDADRVQTVTGL